MRTVTDEVIAILTAAGATVGDATGDGLTPPFLVVYPQTQWRDNGTLDDPWEHVAKRVQVTCEALSRQQAEWWADWTEQVLIGAAGVGRVVPEHRGDVVRDDTTGQPARFKAFVRVRLHFFEDRPDGS